MPKLSDILGEQDRRSSAESEASVASGESRGASDVEKRLADLEGRVDRGFSSLTRLVGTSLGSSIVSLGAARQLSEEGELSEQQAEQVDDLMNGLVGIAKEALNGDLQPDEAEIGKRLDAVVPAGMQELADRLKPAAIAEAEREVEDGEQ